MKGIFKEWVPEWLIKLILFSSLMPSMVLFFLPGANTNVTAGFYGAQPSDIQFLIILFYAGFVGFYVLERRFFLYFPIKQYYIIFHLLQLLNCFLMYSIRDISWVYGLRFFQGMLFASAVNLSISMIFSRLKSDRAKEVSYAVFFGMLLCSSPFNTFVTAEFIDSFNFDQLYLYAALSFVPGLLLIMLSMRSIRHVRPYPLFSLDWASCIFYSLIIVSFGYLMVYGQEVYWFNDRQLLLVFGLGLILLLVFIVRQMVLKRVYIHLSVFKNKKFLLGLLILYMMYVERFSLAISNQYLLQVIQLDPIHLSYIQWFNIGGVVAGVLVSLYWMLGQRPVKGIWISGYWCLLLFHQWMYFSFEGQGNDAHFWLPLFVHGLGVGLIMVPTILFCIASVTPQLGDSAAAVCLAIRYLGYTSSIGLQNFFRLFEHAQHQQVFSGQTEAGNPLFREYLQQESTSILTHGLQFKEHTAALKLVAARVKEQSFVRYAMDYYEVMSMISISILLLILISPSLKSMYKRLRKNRISPA